MKMNTKGLEKGDLVITSRSRYATVVDFRQDNSNLLVQVAIGKKLHWIARSQLLKASDTINLKVNYSMKVGSKLYEDSAEVILPKGTILFDDATNKLESITKEQLESKLGMSGIDIVSIVIS